MRIILGVAFMVAWSWLCLYAMEWSGFVRFCKGSDLWATVGALLVVIIYAIGVYGFVQIAKERN